MKKFGKQRRKGRMEERRREGGREVVGIREGVRRKRKRVGDVLRMF